MQQPKRNARRVLALVDAAPAALVAVVLAALVAAVLLAGCAGWSTDPSLTVRIDTTLDRPLLIYVNGDWVGTIPAKAGSVSVPAAGHTGPPWRIEARTDAGRVLGGLAVAAGQSAAMGATLRCGSLAIVVGDAAPTQAASPGPEPAPCD